jgi:hypothetical protein
MRLDPLLVDQPGKRLGRAVGGVGDQALRVEAEAVERALDHFARRLVLGPPDRRSRLDASLIKEDANREDGIEPGRCSPENHASRATTEYLETLDDAAFGAATPVQPKYVSPVDPAARWSAADRGKAHFLYAANYLVDLENAVIVDVEATAPIRQAENKAARDMIERTLDRFGLYPERLVADTWSAISVRTFLSRRIWKWSRPSRP